MFSSIVAKDDVKALKSLASDKDAVVSRSEKVKVS